MDLVRTVLLYMMMLVGTATGVAPDVTPMPAAALPTPTPIVTRAPATATPVRTPTPGNYRTLAVGDKGSNVRNLQNRLKELGYLTGNVDGNYGQQTKAAVEAFQRANGLRVDGIAGRNTQQVMFESPNVVYASAATPTPTRVPVTATPVKPALVQVHYVDYSTGALLNTDTVQCYGNTYVYADNSKVPATYNLITTNRLYVSVSNGVASPSTVTFRYQRSATPDAGVTIPVYYVDANNKIIARDSLTIYQSGTVTANPSIIPAGYSLSGSSVVYVTVTAGAAAPNPIVFRLNYSQPATPTPTAVPGVMIPVRYINSVTGEVFSVQNVTLSRSGVIYPQRSQVPAGYTLVSASYVSVTVSGGRANPSAVEFRYQPYQPTATPVIAVNVPIQYIDESGALVYQTSVSLSTSQNVFAFMNLVPGYTLTSASSVYVNVRNGRATPSVVTFRVTRTATPTPVPQITYTVRYKFGNTFVASHNIYLPYGQTTTVHADQSVYGANFVLNGPSTIRVTVSASGVAEPQIAVFNVIPRATAVPTAVPQINVPVRYQTNTDTIHTTSVSLPVGGTTYVYADEKVYAGKYQLIGSNVQEVTVTANGIANPSIIIFNLARYATATPVPDAAVTVRYVDVYTGAQIHATQQMCPAGATTMIYADRAVYEGRYVIQGSDWASVTVSAQGIASPSVVTFSLAPVATPTPVPAADASVQVWYMVGDQRINGYTEMCPVNAVTTIYADAAIYQGRYTLLGDEAISVTVDASGHASPDPVIFYLTPLVTPIPSFEVPVQVEYRSGNQLVYSATLMLTTNRQHTIIAESAVYVGEYYLTGDDHVVVNVTEDGTVSPNPVIFYLAPMSAPINPPTDAPYITPYAPVTAAPATATPYKPIVNTPAPATQNRYQTLPSYQQAALPANYDVYQGPGTHYFRGNKGRATYGKGGSARIYGTDGAWLLIGYESSGGDYRIGYIRDYMLPAKVDLNKLEEIAYAWLPATVTEDASVTDDPVINTKQVEKLPAGTQVTFLAWTASDHRWAMIEYTSAKYGPIRTFIRDKFLNIQ